MNRPLADLRLAVMMLDGIELHGRTNIVALGITTEGEKLALGLWEGSSENSAVAGALLADLVDRGLDVEQGLLFVIDGSNTRPHRRQPLPCPSRKLAKLVKEQRRRVRDRSRSMVRTLRAGTRTRCSAAL